MMDCFEAEIARQERTKALQRGRNRRFKERHQPDMETLRKLVENTYIGPPYVPPEPKPVVPPSKKAYYKKLFQGRYPLKAKAHKLVQQALMSGKLRKKCCEACGKRNGVDAHHDDYSKPLAVRWLCREHHLEWHKHNKALYDPAWEKKTAQGVRKNGK